MINFQILRRKKFTNDELVISPKRKTPRHSGPLSKNLRKYGQTNRRTDGRTGGRTDGRTDGPTDGPTDGRTCGICRLLFVVCFLSFACLLAGLPPWHFRYFQTVSITFINGEK